MRAKSAIAGLTGAVVMLVLAPACLASIGTQTFSAAGEQPFTVPPAVTSLDVMLIGGNGGEGNGGIAGGVGATVSATLSVTPGEQLYVEVAGDGVSAAPASGNAGGYGGGGGGGELFGLFSSAPSGGGGGGASDIRTCSATSTACVSLSSRLIVAAGGGGGGGTSLLSAAGGGGGNADMSAGNGEQNLGSAGGGGGAHGTASAGGGSGVPSMPAEDGGLGTGGTGGVDFPGAAGGGGGGGIYGGGGGGVGAGTVSGGTSVTSAAGGGGGGGGSSGIPAGATGVANYQYMPTATGAEPAVTLTWTLPPPAVLTGSANGLGSTSATVNGTVNPNDSQLTDCHFTISPAPPAGSSVPCAQQIAVGGTPVPVSAVLQGLTPSTVYTVTLVAANAIGPASGSAVTFETLASSGPPPPPPGSVPVLSGLSVAHRIHRHVRRHHRVPTTIELKLSESAKLTFTFKRERHRRYVGAGSLTVKGTAGGDRIAFAGRLNGGRRLRLGTYRVTVVATNAAGRSSAPMRASFRLV